MDDGISLPPLRKSPKKTINYRLCLIPLAGCLIMLTTHGTIKSNGLIFVALIHEGHGRAVASAPFSLFGAASIAVGPMVGFLGYRMSFLTLTSFGLSLLLLSHVACFFTTNIYAVTILIGFVKSAAILLITTTIPMVIITTFKERKGTALGITGLGVPLAGFFWPPITSIFLETYGLKGTFLLLGGITLHGMIGILIMSGYGHSRNGNGQARKKHLVNQNIKRAIFDENTSRELQSKSSIQSENLSPEMIKLIPSCDLSSETPGKAKARQESSPDESEISKEPNFTLSAKSEESDPRWDADSTEESPISRKQIVKRVLANHAFYLLSFTNAVDMFTQSSVNQVIVDYMADKDHEVKSAILMITAYSAAGIIGRLSLGWFADKGFIGSHVQKAAGLILTGSSIIVTTFTNSFSLLCVCFSLMGVSQASSIIVNHVQYSKYFAKHEIIMALSLSKVIHGFFQLSRSPTLGIFRDLYESYNCIFRTLGLLLYMSACLWLIEGYFFKKRKPDDLTEKETNVQDKEVDQTSV